MLCESGFVLLVKPLVTHKQTQPFPRVGFACHVPDVYIHFSLGFWLSASAHYPGSVTAQGTCRSRAAGSSLGPFSLPIPAAALSSVHSVSSEDGSALQGLAVLLYF